jgi:hypothetical protein
VVYRLHVIVIRRPAAAKAPALMPHGNHLDLVFSRIDDATTGAI